MQHIFDLYENAFHQHGDSPQAVLMPKGRQEIRFHSLTHHITEDKDFSLLDYGCGLAHLKPFLDEHYKNVNYTGADAVSTFIETCRSKYPRVQFFNAQSPTEIAGEYDYIVASGVFNLMYIPEIAIHRTMVFDMIGQLFNKAKCYLSVNMMTDAVDFQQPHAYHQNVTEIYNFAFENLSRRLIIDQSYMPYEFTLTIWKDQQIQRPANIYGIR